MDQSGNGTFHGWNRRSRNSGEDDQNNRPTNRQRTDGADGEVRIGDEFFLDLTLGPPSTQPPMDHPPPSTTEQEPPPTLGFFSPQPFHPPSMEHPPPSTAEQESPPTLDFFPPLPFQPPPEVDFFSPALDFRSLLLPPIQEPAPKSTVKKLRSPAVSKEIETVAPPYPWATNQRGRIHSLDYLESKQITVITGEVQCKHCEKIQQISYDLREKFTEMERFIEENKENMRERAPARWMNPEAMRCKFCQKEKAVKPVIAGRKREINWLFLLLGKNLGYCTLEQLKYFCKHSNNHRTGAKDRVLYLTYLALCKMLKPCDLFDR